jgi:hypothetical protein
MTKPDLSDRNNAPHTVAFVCQHVFKRQLPVLLVSREGGDWQFLCGGYHDEDDRPHVAGLNHIIANDPTLSDVCDLPENWEAERSKIGAAWRRSHVSDQADD